MLYKLSTCILSGLFRKYTWVLFFLSCANLYVKQLLFFIRDHLSSFRDVKEPFAKMALTPAFIYNWWRLSLCWSEHKKDGISCLRYLHWWIIISAKVHITESWWYGCLILAANNILSAQFWNVQFIYPLKWILFWYPLISGWLGMNWIFCAIRDPTGGESHSLTLDVKGHLFSCMK